MRTFRLWDKKEELVLVDGIRRTAEEIFREVPNVRNSAQILLEIMPNGTVGGIDDLALLCTVHKIAEGLSPEQTVAEITAAMNTEPQTETGINPVEAKIDYLIMMTE